MPLYLLPNALHEEAPLDSWMTADAKNCVLALQGLIAESEPGGRQFLRRFKRQLPIHLLNEHTTDLEPLLTPLLLGEAWGLISDAGLPCLADPGAHLVRLAHQNQIPVHAYPGPSSIVLALQLSGLSGQKFLFHGYPPRDAELLSAHIRQAERRSYDEEMTQIWIEAPYRTEKLLHLFLKTLKPQTILSVALSIGSKHERILSQPVSLWRPVELGKEPAIFLLFSEKERTPIRRKNRVVLNR